MWQHPYSFVIHEYEILNYRLFDFNSVRNLSLLYILYSNTIRLGLSTGISYRIKMYDLYTQFQISVVFLF